MLAPIYRTICLASAAVLLFAGAACDHEHPTGPEHPAEHPSSGGQAAVTLDDVAEAIEAYVEKQGGTIEVTDPTSGEKVKLALDKVHRERLATIGNDVYFACADFKAPDGTAYDIDMFMKGKTPDALTFTEMTVHKVAGKARYTWYKEGGVWKKKFAEGAAPAAPEPPQEHPAGAEHPK